MKVLFKGKEGKNRSKKLEIQSCKRVDSRNRQEKKQANKASEKSSPGKLHKAKNSLKR